MRVATACRSSRAPRTPTTIPQRQYTANPGKKPVGFFRNFLRRISPITAIKETKSLIRSVKEFAVPEYRTALRTVVLLQKKADDIVKKAENREKELELKREEFQASLGKEIQRLNSASETMVFLFISCVKIGSQFAL